MLFLDWLNGIPSCSGYYIPNWTIQGRSFKTNKKTMTAVRAPGKEHNNRVHSELLSELQVKNTAVVYVVNYCQNSR